MAVEHAFMGFPLIFPCLVCVFGPLAFAFWLWMLIECLTKEPSEGNDKLIWALVIILTNWVGAAVYFFVRRPERKRLYESGFPVQPPPQNPYPPPQNPPGS